MMMSRWEDDEDGEAESLRYEAERFKKIHNARSKHYSERSSDEQRLIEEWEDEDND
jgi:hypothetical protein